MRFLFLTLFLLGCSAVPNSDVSIQYSKEARKLGLNPVYPPREEFQIGDVYLWARRPGQPDKQIQVYLTTEHRFRTAADDFLAKRIVFQETGVTDSNQIQTDLFGTTLTTRGNNRIDTLPIAAFPSVSGDAGFSGGVGILRALQAIGIGGGASTSVTLNFNDVRTYWVPHANAVQAIDNDIEAAFKKIHANLPKGVSRSVLEQEYVRSKLRVADKNMCESGLEFGVSVVSRVYLTRSIAYTYRNGRIISAGIQRATSGSLSSVPAAPVTNVNIAPTGALADNDTQLQNLQTQINAISSSQGTGNSLAFQTWDARGITFEQTYARPVSIGWDGYDFSHDLINNLVCPNGIK